MLLAVESPQKKLALKQYFPVAQKQTAESTGCSGLRTAIAEPIFDGQAMFAFSQEESSRCFVWVGISKGKIYTKVAIERNGGKTDVIAFAQQLLAADMGYVLAANPTAPVLGRAIAPQTPILAKSNVPLMPAGGRTKTPGFPSNYSEESRCMTFDELAQLQTVYLATNMEPTTRALLIDRLSDVSTMKIVPNANAADFLVEVDRVDGQAKLGLWAVASRPSGNKAGVRCNVMPNTKPTTEQVVNELGQYLTIIGGSRRGPGKAVVSPYRMSPTGFPDTINGPYDDRILCYKRIPNEEILQFRTIYIAANTPPDLRSMLANAIAATGKYTVVDDAMDANYLVRFDRSLTTETTKYKEADRIATVDNDPTGTAMGMPSDTSEVFIPGAVTYKTRRFEVAALTVMAVKHPEKPGARGTVCGIYSQSESKIKGLAGLAMKNPGKKVTAALVRFLNAPDLSYSDFPPVVLEAMAR